jgi:starch synthase
MSPAEKLHVLFASSEAEPFAKVGGLGDVAGALPAEIKRTAKEQVDIRLVIPFHAVIKEKNPPVGWIGSFPIKTKSGQSLCELYVTDLDGVVTYLLDSDGINHNSPIYYGDPTLDGRKYAHFSVALLEAMRFIDWQIDVLHANDWHTALAVYALKDLYKDDPFFSRTKTILTVHNLPYNGYGADAAMTDLGFSPCSDSDLPDWARLTPLPVGLTAADHIVTVSPGYAEEILTPDYGCGLDGYLSLHQDKLSGILNGIDLEKWSPATDEYIGHPYSTDRLNSKQFNKLDLQRELGLEMNPEIPLLTVVSRLDFQKGIGLIFDAIPDLNDHDWQLVILGTGAKELEERAEEIAVTYPDKTVSLLKYDNALSHKLYASGDIFLMPSLYEPCGLSQMIAMRYGNIPVARATGGLKNTIIDFNVSPEKATGFLFEEKTVEGLIATLETALSVFRNKHIWYRMQRNAMSADFSWNRSALQYLQIYQESNLNS